MKIRTNRWAVAATAATLLVLLVGTAAKAQVMNLVPPDAWMVVKINNLEQANAKVAKLTQQWGLAQMQPDLADPLGALLTKAKLGAGLNKAADAALVVRPIQGMPQPVTMALIPVSDYQAFLGNFTNPQTQDGVTQVMLPNDRRPSYLANWGNYAVLSDNRAAVAGPKPEAGLTLQGLTAQEMQNKDAIVFLNIQAMRPVMLQGIQFARMQAQQGFARALAQAQAQAGQPQGQGQPAPAANPAIQQQLKMIPIAQTAVNKVFDIATQFTQDAQSATYGISLSEQGIAGTLMAEFVANTPSAQLVGQLKNTNEQLVTGLPDQKYLFAAGFLAEPALTTKVVDEFIVPIVQQLSATGGEAAQPLNDYIAAYRQTLVAAKSGAFGMVAPTAAPGQQGLMQFVTTLNGDAKAIAGAQQKMLAAQEQLMQAMGTPKEMVKVTVTPDAKTVDGATFDQYHMQFNMQPKTPQEFQAQQMMNLVYGPAGWTIFSGAVDAEHYVAVGGGDDALLQAAVQAAKSGTSPVAAMEPVKAVAAQLPQNRFAVMYVPVDNIVNTVVSYARMFGAPVQLELPASLPPVGATVASEGNAIRIDSYVPSQLVQGLISAGLQAQQRMMQGAQPGGPAGL